MTRKENLLLQAYTLENTIAALRGESTTDLDALQKNWKFADEAAGTKEATLKERIEYLQRQVERTRSRKALEERKAEWSQTSEGEQTIAAKKAREAELEQEYTSNKQATIYAIDNAFKNTLGTLWSLQSFCDSCLSIGITDEEGKFIFGQRIDIYFEEADRYRTEDRFEVSVPSCGSNSLDAGLTAGSFGRFYAGVGFLFSNGEFRSWLRDILFRYRATCHALGREMREISDFLENPFKA